MNIIQIYDNKYNSSLSFGEKVNSGFIMETDMSPEQNEKSVTIESRVKYLLSKMTLEEKVAQMLCAGGLKKTILINRKGELNLKDLKDHFKNGLGQIGSLCDTLHGLGPLQMVEVSNALQKYFIEETRLGIPVMFHEECFRGYTGKEATTYPQPIGLASTFNLGLVKKIFSAIAEEARARGVHQLLTPKVDIMRDPRFGSVEETFGEDSYLVSQMGIAAVKGLQGDSSFDDKKNVIATIKHFTTHGGIESNLNRDSENISERVFRDEFLFPFKEVVRVGEAISVMVSYNKTAEVSTHSCSWLLKDILRNEWGFKGFVISDYYAINKLHKKENSISHRLANYKKEAALQAINAGINIELPDFDCYPNLVQLVTEGKLSESTIDELVATILFYKFKLGLFDDPYVNYDESNYNLKIENDSKLALTAARETITLLKNKNNILPLPPNKNQTIAVIGPKANYRFLDGYSWKPKVYTSVLHGITEKLESFANVLYSEGCKINAKNISERDDGNLSKRELIKEAVEVAKSADVIIMVLGDSEQTSPEAWSKIHHSGQTNINKFDTQNELFCRIEETGKPIIVVLLNSYPISIADISERAHAILECWYLGQETGNAVADVIFGYVNPSGKLPISIPKSTEHTTCYYNYKPNKNSEALNDDRFPLYPFGFGLSYTNFLIENVHLENESITKGQSAIVYADIKNTGNREGSEVIQLYIHDIICSVARPIKELKGFQKVSLKPSETKTISMEILPEQLAFTNNDLEFVIEPGDFEIFIGNSSRDEDLKKVILNVI